MAVPQTAVLEAQLAAATPVIVSATEWYDAALDALPSEFYAFAEAHADPRLRVVGDQLDSIRVLIAAVLDRASVNELATSPGQRP